MFLTLTPVYIAFATLLGLGIGSFLNVVVLRVYSGETLSGRSHCVNCKHVLQWYELFPLFSYLALRGKCRECHQSISAQYPLVEAATGIAFGMVTAWFIAEPITAVYYLIMTTFLVVIFVFDFKYYLIPDAFSLPGLAIAIIGSLVIGMEWVDLGVGIVIGGGFFWLQYVVSRGTWIGGGDIRLGALMGALLGFPNIIMALFIAYMLGAIVAVPMLVRKHRGMKDQLPFGTFLTVATFITLLVGDDLMSWYLYDILRF